MGGGSLKHNQGNENQLLYMWDPTDLNFLFIKSCPLWGPLTKYMFFRCRRFSWTESAPSYAINIFEVPHANKPTSFWAASMITRPAVR